MSYALITGASAGLGVEFAKLFAVAKHNLVLIARREDRLRVLADELRTAHGITVEIMVADLSEPGVPGQICARLAAQSIEIDYLVNNAGVGSTGAFWQLDGAAEQRQIQLNVMALADLTHRLLPAMVSRRRGKVLNIGSTAGFAPGPYMATYFATKAFVNSFSEALAEELRDTGVTVTVSCPGPTATEFGTVSGNANNRLFTGGRAATAQSVAAEAYAAMMRGETVVIYGAKLKLALFAARFVPRSLSLRLSKKLNLP
jgi:uncharacterized protein